MIKTSIVVGSDGQDGKIISNKLKAKKHKVIEINKNNLNICDYNEVKNLILKTKPNYIFYFAAFHHSSDEKNLNNNKIINDSLLVNFISPNLFLKCIYKYHNKCKFFFSSSSLIFKNSNKRHNEKSEIYPREIYSIAKASTMGNCDYYRENLNIFVNVGIFYNHESEYRKNNFLSKKIVKSAINNYKGSKKKLKIANLMAKIDWGSAHDFMDAVISLQNLKTSGNYIVSTGKTYSILDFVKIAYNYLNLDYNKFVTQVKNILFRNENYRCGNPKKLIEATGWRPKTTFKKMIENMIDYELKL